MEPLRIYGYLVLSRQMIFDMVRSLTAEQYAREFPIGLGTLGRTLTHIMISEWYYVQRMQGRDVPPYEQWPIRQENPPAFAVIEAEWADLAARTQAALGEVSDWHAKIEYEVTTDEGRHEIVTSSAADLFAQLAMHEVHHRAQAMNMLRHLGLPAEDLDFNALMYPRRAASAESP